MKKSDKTDRNISLCVFTKLLYHKRDVTQGYLV